MKWDKRVDFIKMKNRFERDLKKLEKEKLTYRRLKEMCYISILLIQLVNGSRISEAIEGLKKAIEENKNEVYVRVRKQKDNVRLIVIPKIVMKKLKFIRLIVPFITRDKVRSFCRYNYKINTHSLRYAFVSYLGEKGYPAQVIASITQHKNLNYIIRYTQQNVGEKILKEIAIK